MAAAERFGLARRLYCAGAGSARLNGKIAALRFMLQFLGGRNFIPQQPDPAGSPFRGFAEPGNAQRELPWTAIPDQVGDRLCFAPRSDRGVWGCGDCGRQDYLMRNLCRIEIDRHLSDWRKFCKKIAEKFKMSSFDSRVVLYLDGVLKLFFALAHGPGL
mgnify:CR=1 FL=1